MATKFLYPLFVKIFSLLVLVSLALVPFGAALAAQNNNENIVPPPLIKTKKQPFGINPGAGDFSPRLITSSASYTGPTVAIPDFTPAGVCLPISISTTGTITDVRLTGVALAHTWSGDLRLDLYHPGGTYLTVLNRAPAGPTTTWSNLIATSPLNFYDSAATSAGLMGDFLGNTQFICQDNGICDYSPNPDGYPSSVANFAAFNGLNPNGNWQLCASDNDSGDFGSISAFTLQVSTSTQPTVTITSTETSPTNNSPIPVTITFNSIVSGFTVSDITVGNGTATNFAGSGTSYTVDIAPSSSGVVTVDVLQNVAFDLGNTGNAAANQFSITFELNTFTSTFTSQALQDGRLLESSENSNAGGWLDSSATTFIVGDDNFDRQYRSILHFDTSSLPDNAIITKAVLAIKRQGITGSDPFLSLGLLQVDMRKPGFGAPSLELLDFNSPSAKTNVGFFSSSLSTFWHRAILNNPAKRHINPLGTTQFRLSFTLDDNDNNSADFIRFYSGDSHTGSSPAASRPKLIITYTLP